MNSYERVIDTLSHQEPDRTPIFEYVLKSPVADEILDRPYAVDEKWVNKMIAEKGWEKTIHQQAIDYLEIADILKHDLFYIPRNPLPPKKSSQNPPPLIFDDPVKEVAQRIKERENNLSPPEEQFLIYRLIHQEMRKREMNLPIFAPAYTHGVWADVALMQTMILEPELAHRHFKLATEYALKVINKYLDLGIEMIGIGGDFAGNRGPLISPKLYHKFIVPEVRRLSQYIHQAGKKAINGSDGNLWPVIDDFLIGCEVDGYIEIEFRAGMNLAKLKKLFGDRITFFGNLDCANILSFGTPEEVKKHTKECLKRGKGNGGHILCSNNAITESIPLKNFLAIYEAYQEFFQL